MRYFKVKMHRMHLATGPAEGAYSAPPDAYSAPPDLLTGFKEREMGREGKGKEGNEREGRGRGKSAHFCTADSWLCALISV